MQQHYQQQPQLPYPQQGPPGNQQAPWQQSGPSSPMPAGVRNTPDVEDNMPEPSAPPPVQDMDNITGYNQFVGSNVPFVPPPQRSNSLGPPSASPEAFNRGPQITEQEVRECLVRHAKSKCCWGTSAAKSMTINNIQSTTAVHYVLRTYQETRATNWTSEPYLGQYIDGPMNGTPPQPWDVQVPSPPPFTEQVINIEVPHTASVKMCHNCQGHSRIVCRTCASWGYKRCMSCSGFGSSRENDRCYRCRNTGRVQCYMCRGTGRLPCHVCRANGRVRCFILLTAVFQVVENDFILERTPLPDHLIRNVTGAIMLENTQPRLLPLRSFPEPEVNQQSAALIQQHSQLAQTGRILTQYHGLRGVPVFQCDCRHGSKPVQFFVYGNDRMVHAPDYPHKSCCGCQLL